VDAILARRSLTGCALSPRLHAGATPARSACTSPHRALCQCPTPPLGSYHVATACSPVYAAACRGRPGGWAPSLWAFLSQQTSRIRSFSLFYPGRLGPRPPPPRLPCCPWPCNAESLLSDDAAENRRNRVKTKASIERSSGLSLEARPDSVDAEPALRRFGGTLQTPLVLVPRP